MSSKKATCLKVFNMTPRKPNSALRKVAWVLLSNFHRVHAYIPGMGHNTLQKHSIALIRGGRVKDLPGMKYTIIRGKFDLQRLHLRRKARSKYGGKKFTLVLIIVIEKINIDKCCIENEKENFI